MKEMLLANLLRDYRPGSKGEDWTWDDEEADLLSMPCLCMSRPEQGRWTVCPTFGHYQKNLEARIQEKGSVTQGVLLGNDGRVWDGHHRIVAARRLGLTSVPLE